MHARNRWPRQLAGQRYRRRFVSSTIREIRWGGSERSIRFVDGGVGRLDFVTAPDLVSGYTTVKRFGKFVEKLADSCLYGIDILLTSASSAFVAL